MLDKIKEYKELIAIIVFFLGGFFWLNEQFPTKKDLKSEINVLNCLLEKYMTLTQLQLHGQELGKKGHELSQKITDMDTDIANAKLSPAMKFEIEKLKSEFEHNRKEFRGNSAKITEILDELTRNVCGKEGKAQ